MRYGLKKKQGKVGTFRGRVDRFGKGKRNTVLLKEITNEDGKIVCDHLWYTMNKPLKSLNLTIGDIIEFEGVVKQYRKRFGTDLTIDMDDNPRKLGRVSRRPETW